jgi:hypothetical protein
MRLAHLSCCLPAITLAIILPAQGAEWSATPKITLKTGYNDNIRLTTADHDAVWEANLSPSVIFGIAKEHQGISADAGFAIHRFTGGSGRESSTVLDREDYHLRTSAYHTTERNLFRATANYTRDSTLNSEFDETGDVVSLSATRERWTLAPFWVRRLNERTQLSLGGQYGTLRYSDEPDRSNLVEYDNYSVSGSLVRQFTPRLDGTLALGYSKFEPETGFNSETLSYQAGISGSITETVAASILAGQRETTSDTLVLGGYCIGAIPGAGIPECQGGEFIFTGFTDDETDTSGSIYSGNISKILENGSLNMALSRATNPGSQGELLDTTRLVLSGEHRFDERLRVSLTTEYSERDTIVNLVGREPGQVAQEFSQESRKLYRIVPRIAWRWKRELEFSAEYQYAKNKTESSEEAERHAFYVTLDYRPGKIYTSR